MFDFAIEFFIARVKQHVCEYADREKNFSTDTIATTVIANCIGSGFFSGAITETYKQGLYFIIPTLGKLLCLIYSWLLFILRMAEFLGDLSIC